MDVQRGDGVEMNLELEERRGRDGRTKLRGKYVRKVNDSDAFQKQENLQTADEASHSFQKQRRRREKIKEDGRRKKWRKKKREKEKMEQEEEKEEEEEEEEEEREERRGKEKKKEERRRKKSEIYYIGIFQCIILEGKEEKGPTDAGQFPCKEPPAARPSSGRQQRRDGAEAAEDAGRQQWRRGGSLGWRRRRQQLPNGGPCTGRPVGGGVAKQSGLAAQPVGAEAGPAPRRRAALAPGHEAVAAAVGARGGRAACARRRGRKRRVGPGGQSPRRTPVRPATRRSASPCVCETVREQHPGGQRRRSSLSSTSCVCLRAALRRFASLTCCQKPPVLKDDTPCSGRYFGSRSLACWSQ
ncbi:Protein of unknown function [Gryllus bimaculatus]|nr:Protein of unknown function [Gryllus bimaculatus]